MGEPSQHGRRIIVPRPRRPCKGSKPCVGSTHWHALMKQTQHADEAVHPGATSFRTVCSLRTQQEQLPTNKQTNKQQAAHLPSLH
jgi:hypothetical protein